MFSTFNLEYKYVKEVFKAIQRRYVAEEIKDKNHTLFKKFLDKARAQPEIQTIHQLAINFHLVFLFQSSKFNFTFFFAIFLATCFHMTVQSFILCFLLLYLWYFFFFFSDLHVFLEDTFFYLTCIYIGQFFMIKHLFIEKNFK